ncbi:hypothetical protein AYR57_08690 [Pediococcus claussenii]|nr:hypothetical protein AYR57_08690 [Pediococcus claussenii]ANZ72204.1 hypothetical protein AYR58_08690 [Pediococcus claussenii]
MQISSVYVLKYSSSEEDSIAKLPFENDQLSNLSALVEEPKSKLLHDISSVEDDSFNFTQRYSVTLKESTTSDTDDTEKSDNSIKEKDPHIIILEEIFLELKKNIPLLDKPRAILSQDNKVLFPSVIYMVEDVKEDVSAKHLYVYPLKDSMSVRNCVGLFSRPKKLGSTDAEKLEVHEVDNGFYLPEKDCICSFHVKTVGTQQKIIKTTKVYKAFAFSELFELKKINERYAEHTIDKFIAKDDPLKLTQDKYGVSFAGNSDVEVKKVKDKVTSDELLSKSFARFRGTQNSTIQKVGIVRFKKAIKRLNEYVDSDASANFNKFNIPTIDEENKKIIVNEEQVAVFAELIQNNVVERILNNSIQIPYFNRS